MASEVGVGGDVVTGPTTGVSNLVPRAHVPFGQHQDTDGDQKARGLWERDCGRETTLNSETNKIIMPTNTSADS